MLKDFLLALDTYGIPHVSENQTRQRVRKRSDCQTHMKQFFLRKGCKNNRICRWIPSSTKCKTCICILRTDVPDTFFESLSDNSENYILFLIVIHNAQLQYSGSMTSVDKVAEKSGYEGTAFLCAFQVIRITVLIFIATE